jgi:DNA-binding NtrC family response regulator
VGGTEELRVDVRLVAATNRDIAQAISTGDFREDLFHRLNVVQFNLPALRERGNDMLLLAEHFLKIFQTKMNKPAGAFSPAAQKRLLAQRWPGNVRELRNVVERALILETGNEIQPCDLPDFALESRLEKPSDAVIAPDESLDVALERLEREIIQNTLEQDNFSLTRTAERLKLTRHALRYRMQRLNMKIEGEGN